MPHQKLATGAWFQCTYTSIWQLFRHFASYLFHESPHMRSFTKINPREEFRIYSILREYSPLINTVDFTISKTWFIAYNTLYGPIDTPIINMPFDLTILIWIHCLLICHVLCCIKRLIWKISCRTCSKKRIAVNIIFVRTTDDWRNFNRQWSNGIVADNRDL